MQSISIPLLAYEAFVHLEWPNYNNLVCYIVVFDSKGAPFFV